MQIIAIIVTYNRLEMLKDTVKRVLRQDIPCDVFVIDNGSSDGTNEYFAEHFANDTRVSYINTRTNLGGAGGFCFGLKKAYEAGYDYFWLMDDDCLVETNTLSELIKHSNVLINNCGWLSSKCLWKDGNLCNMNLQRKTPFLDLHEMRDATASPIRAQMASFVSLFVTRDTIKKYGYPIREFFIWGDDWEYTRRISNKETCYVVPSSKVVHAMNSNSIVSIAEDIPERLGRYEYAYRNDVYIYRREGLKGWVWIIMKDIWHTIKVLFYAENRKMERISTIWRGFIKGLNFKPDIEVLANQNK